jgi:two-component system KDP operon response regulator KdpE
MLRLNDIQIDQESGAVTRQGEPVQLTRKERQLMRELAASPGRTVSAVSMLRNVWGPSYRREVQYLRVWVSRLRSKLEANPANPSLIKTVQGIGYLLDAGSERVAARS